MKHRSLLFIVLGLLLLATWIILGPVNAGPGEEMSLDWPNPLMLLGVGTLLVGGLSLQSFRQDQLARKMRLRRLKAAEEAAKVRRRKTLEILEREETPGFRISRR